MTAVEAQWGQVKQRILGKNPQVRVYARASLWFRKLELFRKGEDERMFRHEPTSEDLALHKSLLQRLIADGEHLVLLFEQAGPPRNLDAIKASDIAAAVENLRDTYRGWHEPMAAETRAQILHEVFPDVA